MQKLVIINIQTPRLVNTDQRYLETNFFFSVRHRPSHRLGGSGVNRDISLPEVAETRSQGGRLQAGVHLQRRTGHRGRDPADTDELRDDQPDSWNELQHHAGCGEGPQEERTCHRFCINRWVAGGFATIRSNTRLLHSNEKQIPFSFGCVVFSREGTD